MNIRYSPREPAPACAAVSVSKGENARKSGATGNSRCPEASSLTVSEIARMFPLSLNTEEQRRANDAMKRMMDAHVDEAMRDLFADGIAIRMVSSDGNVRRIDPGGFFASTAALNT